MHKKALALAMFVGCLALLAGCGVPEAEVSGMVTVDGAPLPEGDIIFEEVDKSVTPAAARITQGKYELRMLPGSKSVRVTASRPTAKPDPVMGAAAREAMIAEEYNEQTTLKAEIRAGKQEGVNFAVKSIPRP